MIPSKRVNGRERRKNNSGKKVCASMGKEKSHAACYMTAWLFRAPKRTLGTDLYGHRAVINGGDDDHGGDVHDLLALLPPL